MLLIRRRALIGRSQDREQIAAVTMPERPEATPAPCRLQVLSCHRLNLPPGPRALRVPGFAIELGTPCDPVAHRASGAYLSYGRQFRPARARDQFVIMKAAHVPAVRWPELWTCIFVAAAGNPRLCGDDRDRRDPHA